MPDVPRKQLEGLMAGQTAFSSKEGKHLYGKALKKKDLHMELELNIFACVASCWFS